LLIQSATENRTDPSCWQAGRQANWQAGWRANLDLSFARREGRTLLTRRSHTGPLQIQKVLYPEGREICHATVLHPPGGIAAGDSLNIAAQLDAGARVCLTTPGATKWYRCPQGESQQQLRFSLGEGAALEWLPRENILFDASEVGMGLDVDLGPSAQFIGWELLCFGRRASRETWRHGGLNLRTSIRQAGRLLWCERGQVRADSGFDCSAVGLAGCSVSGTLIAAGAPIDSATLTACRSIVPGEGSRIGISALPQVLVARYLGHASQDAFNWFVAVWHVLRPALLGVAASAPRIWAC
jgi:urease accessory protein